MGQPTPPIPLNITSGQIDPMEQLKKELFDLHNQERAKKRLLPYVRNDALDRAAQKHNDWMVSKNRLDHKVSTLGSRIKVEGYKWRDIGENIAKGQRTPTEAMSSWMKSRGHRSSILSKSYKDIGFGVTKDRKGIWWWTTDFGKQ